VGGWGGGGGGSTYFGDGGTLWGIKRLVEDLLYIVKQVRKLLGGGHAGGHADMF
jgi:hypothetical protein